MDKYKDYMWLCESCKGMFGDYEIDYISRTDEHLNNMS